MPDPIVEPHHPEDDGLAAPAGDSTTGADHRAASADHGASDSDKRLEDWAATARQFKEIASMLMERALEDPKVNQAREGAESILRESGKELVPVMRTLAAAAEDVATETARSLGKASAAAEPIAQTVAAEASRVGRTLLDTFLGITNPPPPRKPED